VDQAACINCAELARRAAATLLKPGGNFVAKVFKSNESEVFAKDYRKCFGKFARVELEASRNTSNEFYIVGLEYKGEK
jgi:23S rRNA (uridine2552-2'-O)-methyltransferase